MMCEECSYKEKDGCELKEHGCQTPMYECFECRDAQQSLSAWEAIRKRTDFLRQIAPMMKYYNKTLGYFMIPESDYLGSYELRTVVHKFLKSAKTKGQSGEVFWSMFVLKTHGEDSEKLIDYVIVMEVYEPFS